MLQLSGEKLRMSGLGPQCFKSLTSPPALNRRNNDELNIGACVYNMAHCFLIYCNIMNLQEQEKLGHVYFLCVFDVKTLCFHLFCFFV